MCIKKHIENLIDLSTGFFLWRDLCPIAEVSSQHIEFQAIVKESLLSYSLKIVFSPVVMIQFHLNHPNVPYPSWQDPPERNVIHKLLARIFTWKKWSYWQSDVCAGAAWWWCVDFCSFWGVTLKPLPDFLLHCLGICGACRSYQRQECQEGPPWPLDWPE